ncbi:chlorhexidine efflux transporter [Pigmentiphaga sp.]|uniref:chlorhexidine efflux transporter n=1 Tax=Pigmentiphaga sp. TaxID=1977564 RepID=UPI0039B827A5
MRKKTLRERLVHALCFELIAVGLIVVVVPLVAWWLDISLWEALVLDIALCCFSYPIPFCTTWSTIDCEDTGHGNNAPVLEPESRTQAAMMA